MFSDAPSRPFGFSLPVMRVRCDYCSLSSLGSLHARRFSVALLVLSSLVLHAALSTFSVGRCRFMGPLWQPETYTEAYGVDKAVVYKVDMAEIRRELKASLSVTSVCMPLSWHGSGRDTAREG